MTKAIEVIGAHVWEVGHNGDMREYVVERVTAKYIILARHGLTEAERERMRSKTLLDRATAEDGVAAGIASRMYRNYFYASKDAAEEASASCLSEQTY